MSHPQRPASKPPDDASVVRTPAKNSRPRKPNYNHIHRNPLPIEVHPLPVLIPHNPLSLIAIALSYFTYIISPPPPPKIYRGYFSSVTSSIHVTDHGTSRALWEMGFFGKGSLSRSEPTWLETQRRKGETSEENTNKRRVERRELKLERAKKEHEAIEQRLREEAMAQSLSTKTNSQDFDGIASVLESGSTTPDPDNVTTTNGSIPGLEKLKHAVEANGVITPPLTSASSEASLTDTRLAKAEVRTKSVRFSPTIEAREFDLTSPIISPIKNPGPTSVPEKTQLRVSENEEHMHLSQEEAFFLVYGLGVLEVHADNSDTVLPATSLLSLFRRHSYSPPRSLSVPAEPDDPFLISYVAYHHYRSLGWIVRSGIKFSVNFLLYNRGPAFSHAEFAIVVIPAYTHPFWTEGEGSKYAIQTRKSKSWRWLHCVNRVQSQVKKSLILCYVDVPPPLEDHEKPSQDDIGLLFSRYRVRDISIKRWVPNRSRD